MRDEWEQWRGGAEGQGSRGTKERPSLDPRYYRLTPILALLLLLAVGCVPLPTQSPMASAAGQPTAMDAEPTMAGPLLTIRPSSVAPIVDGELDPVWETAQPLNLPLTWGIRGTETAYSAQLRALYSDDTIYFLAQWPDTTGPTGGDMHRIANKLTVHWTLPPPAAGLAPPACDVACHTAYANDAGHIVDLQAETIPPGANEALPVAGAWRDGTWTVEWNRPRHSANANDLQFTDLTASYPFFIKIFERDAERADPVSSLHVMVFAGM